MRATTGEAPVAEPVPSAVPARVRPAYDTGLAVYHRPADHDGAPRVVYVHGAMDRAASFIRAVRRQPAIEAVRYDRRGYGRSTGIGFAATLDDHVDDLVAVIDDRPSVVIGHSLGGVIALAAARRDPGLVLAFGAFEAPLWTPDATSTDAERAQADAEMRADPELAAERFMRRMIGDDAWAALPESTRATRRAEGPALVSDLAAVRATGPHVLDVPIAVPLVAGCGTASSARHRDSARLLHERTPGSELVIIEGAGHDAHRTHPDAFAAFVDRTVDLAPRSSG
jgi:pimeloyl-ACP methyl ester carboxylesterase